AVTENGTAQLSYQWQKNGVNMRGAASAMATSPELTRVDCRSTYRVVVSNTKGSAASNAATLSVSTATESATVAPTITTHPGNQKIGRASSRERAETANGTAALS